MERSKHGQGSDSGAALDNSLYVHLGSTPLPRLETGDREHFKIRQYVSKKRQKDRSICFPFHSDSDSEQFLPSLSVPKSKYWNCENCILGNGSVSHLEDVVPIPKCNNETVIAENGSADLSFGTDKYGKHTEVAEMIENDQENVEKGESKSKEGTEDEVDLLVGNGLAGSNGSNHAIRLKKPTDSIKSKLVKQSSIQIEEESPDDSKGSRKKGNDSHLRDILGCTFPKRKRKARRRREMPMVAILISDSNSDSEATIDGIAVCKKNWSGRQRSSFDSEKLFNLGSGASSSKSKKGSTTGRKMERKLGSRMPPRQQRERKSILQNVSHKCRAGPNLDAQLQNVIGKFPSREQINHSSLPSIRNVLLLHNLDFSDPCNKEKSLELRKCPEAMTRKRDEIADKGFIEGNSDKITDITYSRYQEIHAPLICRDKGKRIQNIDLNILDPKGASLEKRDLVERELFPKSAPKNSSPFPNSENDRRTPPVVLKLFGIVIEQGKRNDIYVPKEP